MLTNHSTAEVCYRRAAWTNVESSRQSSYLTKEFDRAGYNGLSCKMMPGKFFSLTTSSSTSLLFATQDHGFRGNSLHSLYSLYGYPYNYGEEQASLLYIGINLSSGWTQVSGNSTFLS